MIIDDENQMIACARNFARELKMGDVICLYGPLGVGKSVFARALIRARLEDEDAEVPSPSFTLVQNYETGKGNILHIDLYRLGDVEELIELGIPEIFERAISIIEWPERLGELLPKRRMDIEIADLGDEKRSLHIEPKGEWDWKI